MTLSELSKDYQAHAQALQERISLLEARRTVAATDSERLLLSQRLRMLGAMHREASELAVLTGRYYERGFRRNAKYTL